MRIELRSAISSTAAVELVVLVVVIVVIGALAPPVRVPATSLPDKWCWCCCWSDSISETRTTVGLDVRSVCRWICGIGGTGVDGSSSESVFREEDGVR